MVNLGEINIKNISQNFTNSQNELIHALYNINLKINKGEFVSLIGPSGCGKTTLLRAIAGLEKPTSGEILMDDKLITGTSYERGLVFQDAKLFPWLNIYENIAFGPKCRGIYNNEIDNIKKYISLIGLENFEKSYPHQLSGGMRQRVSLARALVNHPTILLLDEPLGALDALTRMKMQDEILKLWQKTSMTMIMVTHDVEEAVYMSDKIVVMTPRPGKIAKVISNKLERPRTRDSQEFIKLKDELLEIMNFKNLQI